MASSKTVHHMSGSIECLVFCEHQPHTFAHSRLLGVQTIYRRCGTCCFTAVVNMAIVRCTIDVCQVVVMLWIWNRGLMVGHHEHLPQAPLATFKD